jgi:oxygen-independent coproporphyrinogen-3 oxidase
METIGIYIHIPFCKRGCFYCHFVKQAYRKESVERYIEALAREIKMRANPDYIIDTVYIGGGSPSLLNERQVTAIMDAVYENFNVETTIECTFEMNPEDVTRDKLKVLKQKGINRLSIGTQSFASEDLEYLKRTHSVRQSVEAVESALEEGFTNINVDFIISLPTQTRESLARSFSTLKNYEIPHVSAYLLEEVEEGEVKETRDNELYFFTREVLGEMGYRHYEVSNYSKPGFQSAHNLKYWKNQSYIGAGVSASGFEKGEDYKNTVKLNEYFAKIDKGEIPCSEIERSKPGLRRIVMGMRLLEGVSAEYFDEYKKELEFLESNGMLIRLGDHIALNPDKLLLLNEILTYFV